MEQYMDQKKEMAKAYNHKEVEERIYKMWEDSGAFTPKIDSSKKPYTIVLPPPNASGKMHTGNVLMIAIEDLLIRWKRMQGYSALWVPGADHAGFETQVTYERVLKKEGKSRFDFDRQTLYQDIWDFVQQNKGMIDGQIKSMGASVDWSRYTFTLDTRVVDTVIKTFEKMYNEGLIYRDNYMVNYCPKCGTTFADLEIVREEQVSSLYYIKYPFAGKDGYITVATTRPEPIFVDTHLAVNPTDPKTKHLIGEKVLNPLTDLEMEIIGDSFVDPEFGTGIVKLTPGHDKTDYEVAKKHKLPIVSMLDLHGRVTAVAENYPGASHLKGLSVTKAREAVLQIIEEKGLLEKTNKNYTHAVSVCYKANHVIEPMVLPNWFVRVASLKKPALEAVENDTVTIYPPWRKVTYTNWMEEMHDWPISRQVVWGIRIPVWYDVTANPNVAVTFLNSDRVSVAGSLGELLQSHSFSEIEAGLQTLIAPKDAKVVISAQRPTGGDYLQETDTFDTWFSSGQWPLVTLGFSHTGKHSEDFEYFYPTAVLETGWEIIRLWVSRMIMFGIYLTGKAPFKDVYLHGIVKALDGKKMSKSLGNVINPDDYQAQFGTDALRMGLISGTANGKDFAFPKDKVTGYRNFANKIWNMARFINMMKEQYEAESGKKVLEYADVAAGLLEADIQLIKDFNTTRTDVTSNLEKFRFSDAAETIYQFMWHTMADLYIEQVKSREDKDVALAVLQHVYT
ncbi:valine--tRNA ligase, partial [Patescibacteria group bacterium]|nr:valine--tRNA ligase [Patescibacteria group bacterium]